MVDRLAGAGGEFRACKRLRGARRDTGLTDLTAVGLAAQITRIEQAALPDAPRACQNEF